MADAPDAVLDFLEDDALTTPLIKSRAHPDGKRYRIESPDVDRGLFLTRLQTAGMSSARGEKVADHDASRIQRYLDGITAEGKESDDPEADDTALQANRLVLGEAFDEMRADGISWERIRRITRWAFVAFTADLTTANELALKGAFSGGVQPVGNRATRRATQQGRRGSTGSKAQQPKA